MCRPESWALKAERKGKDYRGLVGAGLFVEGGAGNP